MNAKELAQPANLLSLSRVALTPLIAYFLAQGTDRAAVVCLVLMVIATITDGLDGIVARRLNQVTKLGVALDPIADKVFAGTLVVLLIFYRDFPLWLAAAIVARDLLILSAGLLLLRGRRIVLPSNLTGKYTFGAVSMLMVSFVIRFEFGMVLMTWITVALLAASTINYARVFVRVRRGETLVPFRDSKVRKAYRFAIAGGILLVFCYRFYLFIR